MLHRGRASPDGRSPWPPRYSSSEPLRHRPAEEEALAETEAEALQRFDLIPAFDPLGDDLEPEPFADRHDRGGESVVVDARRRGTSGPS